MKIKTEKQKKIDEALLVSRVFNEIETFGSLGREIKISPKSKVTVNKKGFSMEYFIPTVEVLIGIGNNNTARLIMDKKAWEALKKGEGVNIDTLKSFKKNFL